MWAVSAFMSEPTFAWVCLCLSPILGNLGWTTGMSATYFLSFSCEVELASKYSVTLLHSFRMWEKPLEKGLSWPSPLDCEPGIDISWILWFLYLVVERGKRTIYPPAFPVWAMCLSSHFLQCSQKSLWYCFFFSVFNMYSFFIRAQISFLSG